jgi:hypothetical protein
MKIELGKEVTWEKTWYFTKVDDILDHYYLHEEEAQKRYTELTESAKKPSVIEILKTTEI